MTVVLAALLLLMGWLAGPQAIADPPAAQAAPALDLEGLQSAFEGVGQRVAPAVVAISAATVVDDSPQAVRPQEMNADTLQAFLSKQTRMVGAGCIISADGYVLTNDHVIDDAQQIWITTDGGVVYPAIVIGTDPRSDLAVLKAPAHDLPTVHFTDGAAISRGQWSIAIGNPYGLSSQGKMSMSVGVVSAVGRSLPKLSQKENRSYSNLIQTTAQINPGSSGGPLVDLHGDVIGITTAVVLPQKATSGIGFAIAADSSMLRIVNELRQGREIVYGYLGVQVSTPTDSERQAAGADGGVVIDAIDDPATEATAPLRVSDFILAIDGQRIADRDGFARVVGSSPITRPVCLSLQRAGQALNVEVTLAKRSMPVAAVTRQTQRLRWAGMVVGNLSDELSQSGPGLTVCQIDPNSPFSKLGIHEGAVIRTVAGKPVTAIDQLQSILSQTPEEQCDIELAPDTASASVR